LADKHRITYDSGQEDAFLVHSDSGIIKFEKTPDGLYIFKPTANFKNAKGYTQRHFENAKRGRQLYHIARCPTVENSKHILPQNIIKNCPVTADDVNIAKKIFGGDIGALKGKSTRSKQTPVKDDLVEIPPNLLRQHQHFTYSMDIMHVNGMSMMMGINQRIRFRGLVPSSQRSGTGTVPSTQRYSPALQQERIPNEDHQFL
jgi:hypothetical protein